jgi:hypothetical protein
VPVAEDTVSRRERPGQRVGRVVGGLGLLWYGWLRLSFPLGLSCPSRLVRFCSILLFAGSVVL